MPYSDKKAGWNTSVCNKEVAISNTKRNLPQDGNRTSWKSSIGLEDIMALFLRASSLKQIPNESKKHDVLCANFLAVRHTQDRLGERPAILSHGGYVHVSQTTEPLRVEVFDALGRDQIIEAARRTYLYARLLPGYGFPVGLDAVDKYAHVPDWLTNAYNKLIRFHLGVSLQRGEISDAEMRRILVQAIYMTKRDWLFRPNS